jgi:hypothetical protein
MGINVFTSPFGSNNGSTNGIYPVFGKFVDSQIVGAEKWSDGSYNTQGILYPKSFRTAEQTIIDGMISTLSGSYASDNTKYAINETKNKVLGEFVSQYKTLKNLQLKQRMGYNTIPVSSYQPQSLRGVVQLSDSKIAVAYDCNGTAYVSIVDVTGFGDMSFSASTYMPNGCIHIFYVAPNKFGIVTGSGLQIATVSGQTITFGTHQAYSWNNSGSINANYISDNVFAVSYQDNSSYIQGLVCTVAGTVITIGTPQLVSTSAAHTNGNVVSMGAGKVLFKYALNTDSNNIRLRCATFSGTVMTFGAEVVLANTTYAGYYRITPLTTDKAFISYTSKAYNGSTYFAYGAIITTSGTAITINTGCPLFDLSANTASSMALSATEVMFFGNGKLVKLGISGTVITIDDRASLDTSYSGDFYSGSWSSQNFSDIACKVTADKFLIASYGINNASQFTLGIYNKIYAEIRVNGALVSSPTFWFNTDLLLNTALSPIRNYIAIKNLTSQSQYSIERLIVETK